MDNYKTFCIAMPIVSLQLVPKMDVNSSLANYRAIYTYVHECVAVSIVLSLVVGGGAICSHHVLLYLMVHVWAATPPC